MSSLWRYYIPQEGLCDKIHDFIGEDWVKGKSWKYTSEQNRFIAVLFSFLKWWIKCSYANEFQFFLKSVTCFPSVHKMTKLNSSLTHKFNNVQCHCSKCCAIVSHSVMSDSLQPHECSPPGSSDRGDSPGKNTGVGCHALLQGIIPTQGLNSGLFHCRQILYYVSHQGSP